MGGFFALSIISVILLGCTAQKPHPDKPHHTQDGFRNVHPCEEHDFFDFLKWRWNRLWRNIPSPQGYNFPLAKNDLAFLKYSRRNTTLTWIGHATVLLQLEGKNILKDHCCSRSTLEQKKLVFY